MGTFLVHGAFTHSFFVVTFIFWGHTSAKKRDHPSGDACGYFTPEVTYTAEGVSQLARFHNE